MAKTPDKPKSTGETTTSIGTRYELFVKKLYEKLLADEAIEVFHKRNYTGISGAVYEIDLSFQFSMAGARFLVLIECKNYNKAIERKHVSELVAKMRDIRAQKAVLVSSRGFQRGAFELAQANKVALAKVHRDGEFDPVISSRGPMAHELEYYFADYREYVSKRLPTPNLCFVRPGLEDASLIVRAVMTDKLGQSDYAAVMADSDSRDSLPAWWDWEIIVTPHEIVNARIGGFSEELQDIGIRANNESAELAKRGDYTAAIERVERVRGQLTECRKGATLADAPQCLFHLGLMYSRRACNGSRTWWREKGQFLDDTDLIRAASYFKKYKRHLLIAHSIGVDCTRNAFSLFFEMGALLFRLGRLSEAESAFRRLVLTMPEHSDGYANLGLYYLEVGKYTSAAAVLKQAAARRAFDPEKDQSRSAEVLYNLACAQALLGEIDSSLSYLRRSTELNPTYLETAGTDSDLRALHSTSEFWELLRP
ncbi:MAG: tetratricopeptide repeat protein [Deltaproteobacteria bacterium]|nr:tetratricopeptide repeat protein [Deltaproteobacteria bacterium]